MSLETSTLEELAQARKISTLMPALFDAVVQTISEETGGPDPVLIMFTCTGKIRQHAANVNRESITQILRELLEHYEKGAPDVPAHLNPGLAAAMKEQTEEVKQTLHTLRRLLADQEALAEKLAAQGDMGAEFPSNEAESLRRAIKMIEEAP